MSVLRLSIILTVMLYLSSIDILILKSLSFVSMVHQNIATEGFILSVTRSMSGRENCSYCRDVQKAEKKKQTESKLIDQYKEYKTLLVTYNYTHKIFIKNIDWPRGEVTLPMPRTDKPPTPPPEIPI
ncbi:MAG: hypothetical protein AAF984_09420 [Verrucomicrobiota bacterium]